jgi:hypothetical protein
MDNLKNNPNENPPTGAQNCAKVSGLRASPWLAFFLGGPGKDEMADKDVEEPDDQNGDYHAVPDQPAQRPNQEAKRDEGQGNGGEGPPGCAEEPARKLLPGVHNDPSKRSLRVSLSGATRQSLTNQFIIILKLMIVKPNLRQRPLRLQP